MAAFELVDTHTHLNDGKFAGQEAEVIARAKEAGITRLINMGDTLESSAKAVELAAAYEGVYAGVGIHPEEIYELTSADDDQLARWSEAERVVAIGEIGLDYYWAARPLTRPLRRKNLRSSAKKYMANLSTSVLAHSRTSSSVLPALTRSPTSRTMA